MGLLTAMVQTSNLLQKKQIVEERDRRLQCGENASQRTLAEWAHRAQLGFDYHANKNAWMTAEFFTDWLNQEEKFCFLLKTGAHEREETLPSCQNLRFFACRRTVLLK